MKLQADYIYDKIIPTVKETFTDFSVFSVEEPLLEDIVEFDSRGRKFKGFIDLVIKTPDEKYHIIDWKSCSWGWTRDKKNSKMTTYQLTYYKNYFCQKHKIDPKFVDTYFALLKRTAKKENVEIFKVSSGDKKTTNSLKLLENAVINIERKVSIKNRLSCKYCKFYKTEHCE
jgi:ATP-dependent exoDNAse (exonuclease V) beta subunit